MLDKITRTAIIKTTRVSITYCVTDFSFLKDRRVHILCILRLSFILTHTVDPLPMQSSHLLLDTGQLQQGGGGGGGYCLHTGNLN